MSKERNPRAASASSHRGGSHRASPARRLSGQLLSGALAIAALLVASSAAAQAAPAGPAWLADRTRVEGRGVRAGRLELHPGIALELGYDNNVFLSSGGGGDAAQLRDSFVLRVTPHFYVTTMGEERQGDDTRRRPQQVRFRGGVSASYYEYFSLPEQRNLSTDLTLRLDLLPEDTWNFSMFEDFSRGIRPFTNAGVSSLYARDRNRVGAEVGFAPHGGVLEYRLGYAFSADIFEDELFAPVNNLGHEIFLRGRWRFLPKTAFTYEGTVTFRNYLDATGALTDRVDSATIGMRVGLAGLVSTRISINLAVGYVAGFYAGNSGNDLENVTATAEITWAYSPFGRLRLGYLRDSQNSYFGNFVHRDQGALGWQHLIAGRLLLGLEASVSLVRFDDTLIVVETLPAPVPATGRTDVQVRGLATAEYRFTDWLGVTLSGAYTANITDFNYTLAGAAGSGASLLDPAEYTKIEGWLGVRANW